MTDTAYSIHRFYNCIDSYKEPEGKWLQCRNCGLTPKVWLFDNGRGTACGCWNNKYQHWSIHAESALSSTENRDNPESSYHPDDLRQNWNHWCETGEILFEHASKRNDGRW